MEMVPQSTRDGIHASRQGRFRIFAGGLPVFVDGRIAGGIGCSSRRPLRDEAAAQAVIDAWLRSFAP